MRFRRWNRRHGALAVAVLATAAVAAPGLPAAGAAKVPGPALKMAAAQNSIKVPSFRGRVFIDPGIWLEAFGSPLEFDVQRAAYTKPVTITQIIHPPFGGVIRRQLPPSLLDNWAGLAHFATITLRNSAGTVLTSKPVPFCPNSYNAARARPTSPVTSPYPTQCGFNPFTKAQVWGVQRGWAVEPGGFISAKIPLGVYHVTETMSPAYAHLFGVSARDATATVKVTVVKERQCCPVPGCCGGSSTHPAHPAGPGQNPAGVRTLNNPPPAALPDLVALPAWGIKTPKPRKGTTADLLTFGATVWIGGNSPLDVEGFRSHGSPVMKAYQYFWRNGHVIGRVRAGTMGFDGKHGHDHWHFEQFARYTLLNSHRSLVVRSHKVGFCIAPVDGIDLLMPHAVWNPPFTGFTGACGSPSALWVTEELPIGWGDTYEQFLAGQAFDITHVPNGTYFIKVTANPEKVLHETTASNDASYRKVILGGTPGHRTVKVPAWHGIDPEG